MALMNNHSSEVKSRNQNASNAQSVSEGLGIVHYTRSLGRKRVSVSNLMEAKVPLRSPFRTPTKKRCSSPIIKSMSPLESLPQDILVRILCGVDHDDLKQLFHVSKAIREATLIAKQCHFAFSTPTSKTAALRSLDDSNQFEDEEAPNAPKQRRCLGSRIISRKKLVDISVALFASPDEEWPRNRLLIETEI